MKAVIVWMDRKLLRELKLDGDVVDPLKTPLSLYYNSFYKKLPFRLQLMQNTDVLVFIGQSLMPYNTAAVGTVLAIGHNVL